MTIRNEKHVMEDDSVNIINSFLLPWIVYDLRVSDYAIDLYVRIAEINKPVSSDSFHIQLKSTKEINLKDNKISLNNFPTKTLLTFETSYEPTYIALCDLISKKLYWVNVHDEISRLNNTNPAWKKQNTNTIYFNLPQAEFTKSKLKEDVLRIRKKLIIKHSIKLKEDECFEKLYNQMEIESIQENIFSGKINLKDEKTKTLFIADLNFFKIFNVEFDDVSKRIKEIIITITLYEKIIRKKLVPSNINTGLIFMRLSDLFFMLSEIKDFELNINKSIDSNKKALKYYNKKEDFLQNFIIHHNLGLAYKLLYDHDPRDDYLLNQITALNKVLNLAEEKEITPILGQINLSIANLYRKLTDKKIHLIKNQSNIIKQFKSSISHFEKALEYSQYSEDSKEYALIYFSIGILYVMSAELESPHNNLKSSLKYLKKGYNIILKVGNSEEISDYKTKLAVVYRALYDYEKNKNCLKKSIDYLNQALEFWNLEDFPWDYATALKNLAMDYVVLGTIENIKENILKAKEALEKVLIVFSKEIYPERYASTQLTYYEVYITLYENNIDIEDNLNRALDSLNECLKVFTKDFYPYDYATVNLNLGATYMYLFEHSNDKKYIEKSIDSLKEAIELFTLKVYPEDYAKSQNNIGQSYLALSKYCDKETNLKKVLNSFRESLKVRSLDSHPFLYAQINKFLGIVYYNLNKIDKKVEYLEEGIKAYNNALKKLTLKDYPQEYAEIYFNLGGYYKKLAEFKDKIPNLKKAILYFKESLKVIKFESDSFKYEITNNYIGSICFDLIEIEEKEEFIKEGLIAYTNILKNLSKTDNPHNYAAMKCNLGNLYTRLAKKGNRETNLKQSIDAFDEAIEIYYILKSYEQLKNAIANLSEILYFYGFLTEEKTICIEAINYYKKIQKSIEPLTNVELNLELINCLGIMYRRLSKFEDKIENIEISIKYYKEALKIVEKGSEDHGLILNNLGLAYQELSDDIDTRGNLIKSLSTYNESLEYLTKKNLETIKIIRKNIHKINLKLKEFNK